MENLQSTLRTYLEPGEQLLWTGKPKSGVLFRASDLYAIPFSLLWCGFAIFWMMGAWRSGGWLFALFGVPFVVMGLMFVFGRFILDALRRKNTIYGLTDMRVIVKSGIFTSTITSLNLKRINTVSLEEKKDGFGNVLMGTNDQPDIVANAMSWWPGITTEVPRFELIQNAKGVYSQIINLQNRG